MRVSGGYRASIVVRGDRGDPGVEADVVRTPPGCLRPVLRGVPACRVLERARQDRTRRRNQRDGTNEPVQQLGPGLAGDRLPGGRAEIEHQVLTPAFDDTGEEARRLVVAAFLIRQQRHFGATLDCRSQLQRAAAALQEDARLSRNRTAVGVGKPVTNGIHQRRGEGPPGIVVGRVRSIRRFGTGAGHILYGV